jgi:Flp pilus assembly protein TadB
MRERERSMRKTMTEIEALGMSQFQECIDQIVMSVCEQGSYEMLQALDAALSEADDQVTNELRQRRDQS